MGHRLLARPYSNSRATRSRDARARAHPEMRPRGMVRTRNYRGSRCEFATTRRGARWPRRSTTPCGSALASGDEMGLVSAAVMDGRWSGEAKYRALLAVAQAANSKRDLSSVLDVVASALEGLVPIDLLGVVTHGPETVRARAIYHRSAPRAPGESQKAFVRRFSEGAGATGDEWKHTPFLRDAMERDRRTLVLDHLSTDKRVARAGVTIAGAECAVWVPLTMGDEFVAAMVVGRTKPSPFTPDEVQVLEDVARPVTTAVANALAFEEIEKLRSQLEDENVALREEITATAAAGGVIGSSPKLLEVLERVASVAATDSTVLITGETGTGKELLARAIHAGSTRAKRAMVKVNCAALPGGARRFGAVRPREGRFHRRARTAARPLRAGQRRHALPRRGRGAAAAGPGRPAARPPGARVRARGRQRDAADGRARGRGHQPEPGGSSARGEVPLRPLLPAQRLSDPRARAARARRGHPDPRRVLDEPALADRRQDDTRDRRIGHGCAVRVSLARQHP